MLCYGHCGFFRPNPLRPLSTIVVRSLPHMYGDCGPPVTADSKAFEKKETFKKRVCHLCKMKDLRCCEFRSKKTYSFPGFISSWPLLYSHFRKLLLFFFKTFWKRCKVTEPKSKKCSSVRPHVWLRALYMRLTWAVTAFTPQGELNPLLWAWL